MQKYNINYGSKRVEGWDKIKRLYSQQICNNIKLANVYFFLISCILRYSEGIFMWAWDKYIEPEATTLKLIQLCSQVFPQGFLQGNQDRFRFLILLLYEPVCLSFQEEYPDHFADYKQCRLTSPPLPKMQFNFQWMEALNNKIG